MSPLFNTLYTSSKIYDIIYIEKRRDNIINTVLKGYSTKKSEQCDQVSKSANDLGELFLRLYNDDGSANEDVEAQVHEGIRELQVGVLKIMDIDI